MIQKFDEPCPICSSRRTSMFDMLGAGSRRIWWAVCHSCGYEANPQDTRQDAVAFWQTGPQPVQIQVKAAAK